MQYVPLIRRVVRRVDGSYGNMSDLKEAVDDSDTEVRHRKTDENNTETSRRRTAVLPESDAIDDGEKRLVDDLQEADNQLD